MSLSFNEIEAIAFKASRGAGVSWGLAEEAAFAARWLAEHGFDWAGSILARCRSGPSPLTITDRAPGEKGCPLQIGAYLADVSASPDGGVVSGLALAEIAAPLLLLPFLARAQRATPFRLRVGDDRSFWISQGCVFAVDGADAGVPSKASVTLTSEPPPGDASRRDPLARPKPISPEAAEALAVFERRTYVPASAQSRLAGAGAGLSDND